MRMLWLTSVVVLLFGCAIKPQPIEFGKDACVYCKMNIVDQQHAAEIVTKKGKVFKYDAIECMLKDSERNQENLVGMYLVVDYLQPDGFIDATEATYLVSEAIPSPMGEYLSAFKNQSQTEEFISDEKDAVFSWSEIKNKIQ